MDWSGITNGNLLRLASPEFDVFVTSDTNLEFQQNLSDVAMVIVVLFAARNDVELLAPLIPEVMEAVGRATSGTVVHVGR